MSYEQGAAVKLARDKTEMTPPALAGAACVVYRNEGFGCYILRGPVGDTETENRLFAAMSKVNPALPVPTESEEQQTLFSWATMQSGRYPELRLLYHIPNGGSRGKAEAGRFKAEGVKSGVPDLCLPVARGAYHAAR